MSYYNLNVIYSDTMDITNEDSSCGTLLVFLIRKICSTKLIGLSSMIHIVKVKSICLSVCNINRLSN